MFLKTSMDNPLAPIQKIVQIYFGFCILTSQYICFLFLLHLSPFKNISKIYQEVLIQIFNIFLELSVTFFLSKFFFVVSRFSPEKCTIIIMHRNHIFLSDVTMYRQIIFLVQENIHSKSKNIRNCRKHRMLRATNQEQSASKTT